MKVLLELLSLPDNDYWSDEAACLARAEIDDLAPAVFDELLNGWRLMTDLQQEHLASILSGGSSAGEDALIAAMLDSTNNEVAFQAWEAQQESSGGKAGKLQSSDGLISHPESEDHPASGSEEHSQ